MKTKLRVFIAKFLGIESIVEAAVAEVRKDYTKAIEEIAEETNNRLCEIEDSASKVDDIESNVDDLVSKVDDIESAEYVSSDWVEGEIETAKSELSDNITEIVAEAIDEAKTEITAEQVEEVLKKVLTKELILSILAK